MILFYQPQYKNLAFKLVRNNNWRTGRFDFNVFANGERQILINESVKKKECMILASFGPEMEDFFNVMLLAHTLRKEGAVKVSAIFPYMSYLRADKDIKKASLAGRWLGDMLKVSGVDEVLTIEVHSKRNKVIFPIPIRSIGVVGAFSKFFKNNIDLSIVAPDMGAIERCKKFAKLLGVKKIGYFFKKRTKKGIVMSGLRGLIGKRVILFDDILDTGQTLIHAVSRLKKLNIEEINICIAHGLFTRNDWKSLLKMGVRKIYCTNSASFNKKYLIPKNSKIKVIDIYSIIQDYLDKNK